MINDYRVTASLLVEPRPCGAKNCPFDKPLPSFESWWSAAHPTMDHTREWAAQWAQEGWDAALKASTPHSATSAPKYLVRAGGECPQDWLCADIPEVQAALCEALFGNPKDADPDEIGHLLKLVQTMPADQSRFDWQYEDGWVEVTKLRAAADSGAKNV
jgi:hypothetical protein